MTAQRAEVLDSAYVRTVPSWSSGISRRAASTIRCCLRPWARCRARPSCRSTSRSSSTRIRRCPSRSGQTISQPYIVARMIELAEIKPGDKVLEVGAGSGYAAAVMSRMANTVFAIERHEELAKLAGARLKRLGYANAEIIYRRRHQGLARGSAVPGHHRLRRRPACPGGAEAAARDRRPPGRSCRAVRQSDADAAFAAPARTDSRKRISARWPSCR